MNYSILSSRTVWTVIIIAVYNTFVAASVAAPAPWINDVVNVLGVILATYFHTNPSQQYNPPQA